MTVIGNLYWSGSETNRTLARHFPRCRAGSVRFIAVVADAVLFRLSQRASEGHSMKSILAGLRTPALAGATLGLLLGAVPAHAQVKIGFQAPLTGPAATDGVSAKVAAELAIERINAKGGILGQKAELVMYDDQAKTEEAVFTANKLVGQDGVKFAVSGSYSASGRAAAPIFQNAKVPFISAYGVHPDITRAVTTPSGRCIWGSRRGGRARSSSPIT